MFKYISQRFNEVFYHPSVRRYDLLKDRTIRVTGNPGIGNEKRSSLDNMYEREDFRTPYQHSQYDVQQLRMQEHHHDQKNDCYFYYYNENLKVSQGDSEYKPNIDLSYIERQDKILSGNDKIEKKHFIREQIMQSFDTNKEFLEKSDVKVKGIYVFNTYNLIADDPDWRQNLLEIEHKIEQFEMEQKIKPTQIFQPDKNWWQLMPNNFDQQIIEDMEMKIGNRLYQKENQIQIQQNEKDKLYQLPQNQYVE